jgi:hypothetical protein
MFGRLDGWTVGVGRANPLGERRMKLSLLVLLGLSWSMKAAARSKIWQGSLVKIEGSVVYIEPQYTPYAGSSLYPIYYDSADTEGQLLTIDIATVQYR